MIHRRGGGGESGKQQLPTIVLLLFAKRDLHPSNKGENPPNQWLPLAGSAQSLSGQGFVVGILEMLGPLLLSKAPLHWYQPHSSPQLPPHLIFKELALTPEAAVRCM